MLRAERKTQAQAAYEVLTGEGFRCFIGTKDHNCHIVSVFHPGKQAIQDVLNRAIHHPVYEMKKIKERNVFMLHFKRRS
jgi:secreted PhoX family phosphatase